MECKAVPLEKSKWFSRIFCEETDDTHSDDCSPFRRPTQRQLKLLIKFSSAVAMNKSVSRHHIQNLRQERDGLNTQSLRSSIYCARDELVEDNDVEWSASFSLIRSLLTCFRDKNPGTHVALDLDTDQRFFRAFVSLGATISSLENCLPVLGFNGTHSKNDKYRGVILTLISRDGNGNNITIAFAVVHSENEANIEWLFSGTVSPAV